MHLSAAQQANPRNGSNVSLRRTESPKSCPLLTASDPRQVLLNFCSPVPNQFNNNNKNSRTSCCPSFWRQIAGNFILMSTVGQNLQTKVLQVTVHLGPFTGLFLGQGLAEVQHTTPHHPTFQGARVAWRCQALLAG